MNTPPLATDSDLIRLQDLPCNQVAKVVAITGNPQEIARISSMGLRTGSVVSVTRGGITCIVQLENGNRLCLRMSRELEILARVI